MKKVSDTAKAKEMRWLDQILGWKWLKIECAAPLIIDIFFISSHFSSFLLHDVFQFLCLIGHLIDLTLHFLQDTDSVALDWLLGLEIHVRVLRVSLRIWTCTLQQWWCTWLSKNFQYCISRMHNANAFFPWNVKLERPNCKHTLMTHGWSHDFRT